MLYSQAFSYTDGHFDQWINDQPPKPKWTALIPPDQPNEPDPTMLESVPTSSAASESSPAHVSDRQQQSPPSTPGHDRQQQQQPLLAMDLQRAEPLPAAAAAPVEAPNPYLAAIERGGPGLQAAVAALPPAPPGDAENPIGIRLLPDLTRGGSGGRAERDPPPKPKYPSSKPGYRGGHKMVIDTSAQVRGTNSESSFVNEG